MNNICDEVAEVKGVTKHRVWSAAYHNMPLCKSALNHKPDIALLDIAQQGMVTWHSIHAVAEVTSKSYDSKTTQATVRDKSYVILVTQANHVFVLVLSFWGQCKFWFTVTDHKGQLHSHVINLGGHRPPANSLAFLRALVALCFVEKQHVGYDLTMETNASNAIQSIKCADLWFKVVEVIYETQSLVGHATRVWHIKNGY